MCHACEEEIGKGKGRRTKKTMGCCSKPTREGKGKGKRKGKTKK